ncbi:hypothetical protein A8950_0926 [Dongia mobilis]|uniref:FlgN protein n=1 Tax=Dongia mobilis TaxID=578943 RepID=A0A4R6WRY9_9PROT|nr:hypothetical protein [Dongia mobilis]TDQ84375.1 hypothetical protein A8950_0926 [Dongia mobilis]
MNKSTRVTELLAITSQLIGCMERELELLRSLKPTELKQLQLDKVALADAYQAFTMALKEPGEDLASVNQALRDELTEATERFQGAVQDNLRALKAMRDVNERVMRAVVQALEEKRAAVTGYNARGSVTKSRRQPASCPVAVQQRA